MGCSDEIIQKLQQVTWRSVAEITPQAEAFIREHIAKMSAVLKQLNRTQHLGPIKAYARAQSAGHQAAGYDDFMDRLFDEVEFRGAGVREHIILAAAAYCFWSEDPDVCQLENPWAPVMKLYEAGYTSSFEENEREQSIKLLFGYKEGIKPYALT